DSTIPFVTSTPVNLTGATASRPAVPTAPAVFTGPVTLTSNTFLTAANGSGTLASATFNGVISGSATLTIAGGVVPIVFNNNNTYTRGTIVARGILPTGPSRAPGSRRTTLPPG